MKDKRWEKRCRVCGWERSIDACRLDTSAVPVCIVDLVITRVYSFIPSTRSLQNIPQAVLTFLILAFYLYFSLLFGNIKRTRL